MLIKVSQIKALAKLVEDMPDEEVTYVNNLVKDGVDNGEVAFGVVLGHTKAVIRISGKVVPKA